MTSFTAAQGQAFLDQIQTQMKNKAELAGRISATHPALALFLKAQKTALAMTSFFQAVTRGESDVFLLQAFNELPDGQSSLHARLDGIDYRWTPLQWVGLFGSAELTLNCKKSSDTSRLGRAWDSALPKEWFQSNASSFQEQPGLTSVPPPDSPVDTRSIYDQLHDEDKSALLRFDQFLNQTTLDAVAGETPLQWSETPIDVNMDAKDAKDAKLDTRLDASQPSNTIKETAEVALTALKEQLQRISSPHLLSEFKAFYTAQDANPFLESLDLHHRYPPALQQFGILQALSVRELPMGNFETSQRLMHDCIYYIYQDSPSLQGMDPLLKLMCSHEMFYPQLTTFSQYKSWSNPLTANQLVRYLLSPLTDQSKAILPRLLSEASEHIDFKAASALLKEQGYLAEAESLLNPMTAWHIQYKADITPSRFAEFMNPLKPHSYLAPNKPAPFTTDFYPLQAIVESNLARGVNRETLVLLLKGQANPFNPVYVPDLKQKVPYLASLLFKGQWTEFKTLFSEITTHSSALLPKPPLSRADVMIETEQWGPLSLLSIAALTGHMPTVNYLLERGANKKLVPESIHRILQLTQPDISKALGVPLSLKLKGLSRMMGIVSEQQSTVEKLERIVSESLQSNYFKEADPTHTARRVWRDKALSTLQHPEHASRYLAQLQSDFEVIRQKNSLSQDRPYLIFKNFLHFIDPELSKESRATFDGSPVFFNTDSKTSIASSTVDHGATVSKPIQPLPSGISQKSPASKAVAQIPDSFLELLPRSQDDLGLYPLYQRLLTLDLPKDFLPALEEAFLLGARLSPQGKDAALIDDARSLSRLWTVQVPTFLQKLQSIERVDWEQVPEHTDQSPMDALRLSIQAIVSNQTGMKNRVIKSKHVALDAELAVITDSFTATLSEDLSALKPEPQSASLKAEASSIPSVSVVDEKNSLSSFESLVNKKEDQNLESAQRTVKPALAEPLKPLKL